MPFTLPNSKQHGINIPLFSIRSAQSCGIGEYLDLIPLIHWCKDVGFHVLQTLPLNDTGDESSPYCSLTATALNPIFLSLSHLPGLNLHPHLGEHLRRLQALNSSPYIDYKTVINEKMQFLKEYYSFFKRQIFENHDFREFFYSSQWLKGYALFKAIKLSNHWRPWQEWDDSLKACSEESLKALESKFETEIDFHIFVQFLCFHQMAQVKAAAEAADVALMGDLPILINKESADVWLHQNLFDLTHTAGAPPDQYSQTGQNWNFPLYNWDALKAENYNWWIERLHCAARFYHLYRIDHVVGFFRIWSIPVGLNAAEGAFNPPDPSVWIAHGDAILQMMVGSTQMIPIAEDLGTVPDEVRDYLREHKICGTRVMRWERHWHTDRSYIPPEDYIWESLTTVSTHDSELLTQWWKNQPEEAGNYAASKGWDYTPQLTMEQRLAILKESHHTGSLYHVNLINEYLNCIPELAWDRPEEERINVPGVVSEHNWTLKVKPTIEQIISNKALKNLIRSLFLFPLFFFAALQAETDAHIKMIYSSLSPTSIAQHLAFYQLYPNTPYGEKALEDAWKLLGRGVNDTARNGEILSNFPELTAAIVNLINNKEGEPVLLKDSEIEVIDKFASFLPNRKLKGFHATNEEEVIALPPEEIDLARGLFLTLLTTSSSGWQEMRSYESLLDLMALQVMLRLPQNPTPKDKIKAMNDLIFFEMGYRFPPESLSTKDIDVYTFLPSVLNSRKGVCLGVSILYLCLAQRLDLPLEMITPPGHIYVRYKNDKSEINIETTCRGVHVDSDYYLTIDTCALEQQNIKQVIGLAYMNQASVFMGTEKFDQAEIAYKKALSYHPDYEPIHRFLGLSLCMNGKEEEGREHLALSCKTTPSHQVSPDTLATDYLNGKVNAEGIARFAKHTESTRAAILEEKEAYEKILKEYPEFRSGWLGLAGSWLELGNERQALKALEAYHEIDANNATVEFYLANLYAKRLDFQKGWDRLCSCEKLTQSKNYTPEAVRDFRESLQQLSPE